MIDSQARRVIHVDMDAFYAAIEMRERPELRCLPLAIGGSVAGRGVIATANYLAREYGVRSAMPTVQALKLCPELVLLPCRFDFYLQVSQQIFAIFRRYTELVETVALDEAYLDVSHLCKTENLTATKLAQTIKAAILNETRLTASTGVAPNKLMAKLASEHRKPDGMTIITPGQVANFVAQLALIKLPGIGPVTNQKLAAMKLHFCRDITEQVLGKLQQNFGERFTNWLWLRARGIDDRPVKTQRKRKSLGREETFPTNIVSLEDQATMLCQLCEEVSLYLQKHKLRARSLTIKIRFADFQTLSRSWTPQFPYFRLQEIQGDAGVLLKNLWQPDRPVRLLGVSLSNLLEVADINDQFYGYQPELFPEH